PKNGLTLNDSRKQILSYFVPVTGMEETLALAIGGAEDRLLAGERAVTGNIIIQGASGSGRTTLAADLIEIFQSEIGLPKGGAGRISGANLNNKDIAALYDKIRGGSLIIEDAGELNRESVVRLSILMEGDRDGTMIILEDGRLGFKRLRALSPKFIDMFTEKIVIPTMTIDELVNFGKTYAFEHGYRLDEMAVLALYDRIDIRQRQGQGNVTLTQVRDIMDRALEHAGERKGGLFGLLSPRGKEEGATSTLVEKDFV
ncbi:MAG: hypothetical protein IIU44_04055, partial [Spirochaetales bacterium]|nr:hypothetical protein [Spirochaetales bacterium]